MFVTDRQRERVRERDRERDRETETETEKIYIHSLIIKNIFVKTLL